jgi:hypothetical protein
VRLNDYNVGKGKTRMSGRSPKSAPRKAIEQANDLRMVFEQGGCGTNESRGGQKSSGHENEESSDEHILGKPKTTGS